MTTSAEAKLAKAQRLDGQIRTAVTKALDANAKLAELITRAQESKIHETLGFPTWQAYVTSVAVDMPMPKTKAERVSAIHFLLGQNLSLRACAEIAGVSKSTVENVKKAGESGESAESGESTESGESAGKGGPGAAQVHKKITDKTALSWVKRITEHVDELESIEDLGEMLRELPHTVKAVEARRDYLVKVRDAAKKSHPSSSEGNNGRTGDAHSDKTAA